jgi:molybdenum cofactor synthesis domain-containing protein
VAVLVVSDRAAAGTHSDESGPAAEKTLRGWGAETVQVEIVPDDPSAIRDRLRDYADQEGMDLILTSGGTGLAPRDQTPEATRDVLDRGTPGVAELLRRESSRFTRFASLSRGVAGTRGQTLIINLPGSPKSVVQCLEVLEPILPHALRLLRGETVEHAPRTARSASPPPPADEGATDPK